MLSGLSRMAVPHLLLLSAESGLQLKFSLCHRPGEFIKVGA
jgi:hypothetical protein